MLPESLQGMAEDMMKTLDDLGISDTSSVPRQMSSGPSAGVAVV